MEMADRQNLAYVYRELNLQMFGDVSGESARSIGKFPGADLVITGRFTATGCCCWANVVNAKTAARGSVTRLDVRGTRRLLVAPANQQPAAKTALKIWIKLPPYGGVEYDLAAKRPPGGNDEKNEYGNGGVFGAGIGAFARRPADQ
jgi:hypothetical protein